MASCNICLMDYEPITVRPVVGSCGHTLCEPCSKKINGQCPTCRKASFADPVVNFEVLEMIHNGGDSCCHRKFQGIIRQMEKKFNDKVEEIQGQIKADYSSKMEAMEKRFHQERDTVRLECSNGRLRLEKQLQLVEDRVNAIQHGEAIDNISQKLAVLRSEAEKLKEQMKETRKRKGIDVPGSYRDQKDEFHAKRIRVKPGSYKCFQCDTAYPETIVLRKDGVSSVCPNYNCGSWNVVRGLKCNHRWVFMECEGGRRPHVQQISVDNREGTHICLVCGNEGTFYEVPTSQIAQILRGTSQQQAGPSQDTERPCSSTSRFSQCTIPSIHTSGEENEDIEVVVEDEGDEEVVEDDDVEIIDENVVEDGVVDEDVREVVAEVVENEDVDEVEEGLIEDVDVQEVVEDENVQEVVEDQDVQEIVENEDVQEVVEDEDDVEVVEDEDLEAVANQ